VGFLLENQRLSQLGYLKELLVSKIQAMNIANRTHVTEKDYGAAIDEAQVTADAFTAVHVGNPLVPAQAFSDAHDALVVAVRNNGGQFPELIDRLQAFAERTDEVTSALASSKKP
jgi:hypothetical protein